MIFISQQLPIEIILSILMKATRPADKYRKTGNDDTK